VNIELDREGVMSTKENKVIIRRFFEEFRTRGELGALNEIFSSEFILQTRRGPRPGPREFLTRMVEQWFTAFPDYQDTILSLVAEGDWVAAHVLFSGTHTGVFEYGGLGPWAPTGKPIQAWEFFLFRLVDGKIVEISALWDRLDFVEQLGLGSAPAPSSAVRPH
jgi:predicted ester cyclase